MIEKITVIIPTYKRPRLLIRCLQALEAQSINKNDYKVIVVSDGPDLITKNIIENWLTSVNLHLNFLQIEKGGPAAARNHGWKQAKSRIIAFTDDDCVPSPHWLAAFLHAEQGQTFIAYTGQTRVPLPAKKTDFAINLAHLTQAEFITANCACTRAALLRVGGFDERFKMAWREDSDLQFKFIRNLVEIVKVDQALVIHPVRAVPWGISLKEQKKGLYDALLFKKYPDLYRQKIHSSIGRYYFMLLFLSLLLWCIIQQHQYLAVINALLFTLLVGQFIGLRLQNRHKSFSQVTEMIITSFFIPFLSIFWRVYGSVKYRIVFI
ncbi:glycosyltransferase involved in cell wall biosynthesis [Pedobacter sp. CAN_A7]|uniref:glycosyltransferase family 2 protein n=1 Tax=Pedobacter sp. CAN_A7 TaxID=2787722 RepID=UPI001A1C1EFA